MSIPKTQSGSLPLTSLEHDATPLKAKIESSLYQDFHVLYVHIERDKKQEGNESEKLSQFCSRRRAPYYLCSRASARFHTVPLPPTLASLGSTRQFQWNIDEMQKESPSPKCKRPFQYFLAPFSIAQKIKAKSVSFEFSVIKIELAKGCNSWSKTCVQVYDDKYHIV